MHENRDGNCGVPISFLSRLGYQLLSPRNFRKQVENIRIFSSITPSYPSVHFRILCATGPTITAIMTTIIEGSLRRRRRYFLFLLALGRPYPLPPLPLHDFYFGFRLVVSRWRRHDFDDGGGGGSVLLFIIILLDFFAGGIKSISNGAKNV